MWLVISVSVVRSTKSKNKYSTFVKHNAFLFFSSFPSISFCEDCIFCNHPIRLVVHLVPWLLEKLHITMGSVPKCAEKFLFSHFEGLLSFCLIESNGFDEKTRWHTVTGKCCLSSTVNAKKKGMSILVQYMSILQLCEAVVSAGKTLFFNCIFSAAFVPPSSTLCQHMSTSFNIFIHVVNDVVSSLLDSWPHHQTWDITEGFCLQLAKLDVEKSHKTKSVGPLFIVYFLLPILNHFHFLSPEPFDNERQVGFARNDSTTQLHNIKKSNCHLPLMVLMAAEFLPNAQVTHTQHASPWPDRATSLSRHLVDFLVLEVPTWAALWFYWSQSGWCGSVNGRSSYCLSPYFGRWFTSYLQ